MNRAFLLSGVAFFGAMMPMAAQAQSEASNQPGEESVFADSEIIVTARRREESLQSVPIAVTVYGTETLEKRSIRSAADLSAIAPSLIMQGAAGRRNTPSIGIRGQRTQDTLITGDPAVSFYFDEVILTPNQGLNLGLYDLGSVQVLKGPQGTLFGRNSTGGAVLFTSNKPTDTFGAGITARYGNYDERAVTGYINIPVTPELRFRVAGNYVKNDGYGRIVAGALTGHRLDSTDDKSVRVTSVWEPTADVKNTLTFAYDKSDSGGAGFVLTALNPATSIRFFNGGAPFNLPDLSAALARQQGRSIRQLEASSPIFETVRSYLVVNHTEVDLGEVKFKNIFGFRDLKYGVGYDGDDSPIFVFAVNNPARVKQYSNEIQLSGTAFQDKMSWIAGFYYFKATGNDVSMSTSYTGLNPNTPNITGGLVNNRSISGYLQQTSEILPRLSLTTGFRYTVDQRRVGTVGYPAPTAPNFGQCAILAADGTPLPFNPTLPYNGCLLTLNKTFSSPTWTVSLDYKIDDNKLVYLASRRGYRTGGFNGRAATEAQRAPFQPETVTDFEAGLKLDSHPMGWTVRTNAAAYLQKYNKIQRNVTFLNPVSGGVTSSVINAAKATIWGGELEVTVIPTRAFELGLAYSYVHAEYDKFETAAGDFSDREFSGIPKHQFNADFTYIAIDDTDTGKVSITGNYIYRSGFYNNELFQTGAQIRTQAGLNPALVGQIPDKPFGIRIPKVGLFNGRISWEKVMGSDFSLALYGKNLANKTYRNSGLSLYESLGLILNTYGDPRTYGLEVSYKF